MICPNCQTNNLPLTLQCQECGTALSTGFQAPQRNASVVENSLEEDREKFFDFFTWPIAISWLVAIIFVLLTYNSGIMGSIHHTFGALTHEFGHCIFMTIYGDLAIPSFGFLAGGAFAMGIADVSGIQFFVFAGLGYMIWLNRDKPVGIAVFSLIGLLYGFTYYSEKWGTATMLYMGHGNELLIAGIFLYRALSGYAVNHALERFAYMLCCVSLFVQNVDFTQKLCHNYHYMGDYEQGRENGMLNDFYRIHFDGHFPNLETLDVAHFHWWMTVITPFLVLAIFLWRRFYLLSLREDE